MSQARVLILIVDDRQDVLEVHTEILREAGYWTKAVQNPREALALVQQEFFDLLVLDDRMPGMTGRELLRACRKYDAEIGAIFVSAYEDPETLADIIRLGATDYVPKSTPDFRTKLPVAVRRALDATRQQRQNRWLWQQVNLAAPQGPLVGKSPAMARVREWIRKVAVRPEVDVLIIGETGTGKELAARELHRLSPHAEGPFLACNLGGLSSTLIAAELFGVAKGAFTGASEDRVGYFEAAHGGTLLLDEIGDMPLADQATLLRVIETRQAVPVGSTRARAFEARLIAATNRDLAAAVEEGTFRRDLLARLNRFSIPLPPLREREGDIELLAFAFVHEICSRLGRPCPRIPSETLRQLSQYRWPGNIREFRNVLEQALILDDTPVLTPDALNIGTATPTDELTDVQLSKLTYDQARRAFDRRYLSAVLASAHGNKSQAARMANIDRSVLYEKLEACGLTQLIRKRGES